MATETSVPYVSTGHEQIVASMLHKHQLQKEHSFTSRHTDCTIARSQSDDRLFIKVKGYVKNPANEAKFRRAVVSNRMAGVGISGDVAPTLLDLQAFERDGAYWLVMLTPYGGEPMSRGLFLEGPGERIDDQMIERIRYAIEVIGQAPSMSVFYAPEKISRWIHDEFGANPAAAASEWTSAHCDFHWGNILSDGRQVIDWDMFSLAPGGFDAASILLYSAVDRRLFERLYVALADQLAGASARTATLFAAARILRLIRLDAYSEMRAHEVDVRWAVDVIMRGGSR
ncbi:MAG: phosphotransferase [Sedimenticolaceae bacterium]